MSNDVHRFRLGPAASISDIVGLLDRARVDRVPGTTASSCTWYDTFDGRLAARGWSLCRIVAGSTNRLELDANGALTRADWAEGDPTFWRSLPPQLGQMLAAVMEERVLLPLMEIRGRETTFALLDDEDKTVARLTFQSRRAIRPRRAVLDPVVSLVALRGYGKVADAMGRLLAADTRLERLPVGPPAELRELLEIARPPKLDLTLTSLVPSGTAVRAVLIRLLEIFQANLNGTVADLDSEFLHDLRVSVRRARSIVKLMGDALPPPQQVSLATGLKWLGDLTTPTRDLDVYLEDLVGSGQEEVSAAIAPFRAFLQQARHDSQSALARGLRSPRTAQVLKEWAAIAHHPEEGPDASTPIGVLASERTAKAYRRVVRDGRRVTVESPAEALHDLRKRGKELRYLLEVFASLHPPDTHRQVVSELKRLQDCLGTFQDAEVQSLALTDLAEQMMAQGGVAADTIMAMGALASALGRRQDRARGDFRAVFARFDDPQTDVLVRSLLKAMKP